MSLKTFNVSLYLENQDLHLHLNLVSEIQILFAHSDAKSIAFTRTYIIF